VILGLKGKGSVDEKDFASQKTAIANYLTRAKKTEAMKAWIEGSKAALIKEGRLLFTRDVKDL